MAETVKATYNGFPVEVVYSASVQELVFYFNPDAVRIEDRFDIGHRTFTGVTLEQWRALQNVLQRPNTASRPTAPCAPAGDDPGDSRRGGLC